MDPRQVSNVPEGNVPPADAAGVEQQPRLDRRDLFRVAGAAGVGAMGISTASVGADDSASQRDEYNGPNVVMVRFGGGIRRRESIDPDHTYSPYFCHELIPRGTLYPLLQISGEDGVETGHGQGTLNILTGKYEKYEDVDKRFLGERFEAQVPTLFEYLRKKFAVPEHETLIINGEDRTDEEFYTFSNHRRFGYPYRSNVLSLYRYKTYLLRQRLQDDQLTDAERRTTHEKLAKLQTLDYRVKKEQPVAEIDAFWDDWMRFYGRSGYVNPRGDRLLTELAIRSLSVLRPRLMMINYNDCDYVHWGNVNHYTRAISIMDQGLKELSTALQLHDQYRDNTVLVVVPDCGRDSNRFAAVPFQHHFNSPSSRQIFALFVGAGIPAGQRVDRGVEQIQVAPTVARLMGMEADLAQGDVLEEAIG